MCGCESVVFAALVLPGVVPPLARLLATKRNLRIETSQRRTSKTQDRQSRRQARRIPTDASKTRPDPETISHTMPKRQHGGTWRPRTCQRRLKIPEFLGTERNRRSPSPIEFSRTDDLNRRFSYSHPPPTVFYIELRESRRARRAGQNPRARCEHLPLRSQIKVEPPVVSRGPRQRRRRC
jgi:hypothetical protein